MCRYRKTHQHTVDAPAGAPPIVLLPGFGNNTLDYTAPFGDEEAGIAAALQVRALAASTKRLAPSILPKPPPPDMPPSACPYRTLSCRQHALLAAPLRPPTPTHAHTPPPPASRPHTHTPYPCSCHGPVAAAGVPRLCAAAHSPGLVQGGALHLHPRLLGQPAHPHNTPWLHVVRARAGRPGCQGCSRLPSACVCTAAACCTALLPRFPLHA